MAPPVLLMARRYQGVSAGSRGLRSLRWVGDGGVHGVSRTIPTLVRAAVDAAGDKTWLVTDDVEYTYAQAQARIERAASGLRAAGRRGGRPGARHAPQHRRLPAHVVRAHGGRRDPGADQPEEQRRGAPRVRRAGRAGADRHRRRRSRRCSRPDAAGACPASTSRALFEAEPDGAVPRRSIPTTSR